MIKKNLVFVIFLICLSSLSAQTYIGKIDPYPAKSFAKTTGIDTVKILAVMVEFQTDKDEATDGNGKFGTIYTQDYGNTILDPLPHDRAYFEEHLEFAKNYFHQVSNGHLIISYYVLPKVITVSKTMRNYSPQINSNDFSSLANFSREVWEKADTANPGFNFSSYNLFTIYHAGVGRDVSLPGSIADSRDLPSIYLSSEALKNIYGSGFNGFPVENNSFDITNSLIMPETESREQSTYGGTVLYQVTTNGLLAASIGSYLGLPDLFDTQTGQSAIGRFGLMDPQSIFAYNGVFPPEPSAWEKIFLGWAAPITLSPGKYNINLVTQLAAVPNDTTIVKLPINSSEYFLLENRNRNALGNGVTVTYVLNGNTYTKTFTKDQPGFYSYDTDSLKGVITDVSEFDWALPGQIDDTSDYKGGILIWHIDDNVINAKIASDEINADKAHRGVNLMEASGIPEIGEIFTDALGDQIIGEGTYQDYWYKNNYAKLYKNIFSSTSTPNSNANSGANSLITISDFSSIGNRMSFNVVYGDSILKPIFSSKVQTSSSGNYLTAVQDGNNFGFNFLSNSDLSILDNSGNIIKIIPGFSKYKVASISNNGIQYVIGVIDSTINIYSNNGTARTLNSYKSGMVFSTSPVLINKSNAPLEMAIGTKSGIVEVYSLNSNMVPLQINTLNAGNSNFIINKICSNGNNLSYAASLVNDNKYIVFDSANGTYSGTGTVRDFAMSSDKNGNGYEVLLLNGNKFDIINKGVLQSEFAINSTDTIKSFSLTDLKQDGNNYIIFSNGNKIDAVNLQGAEAENFPFDDPLNIGFTGLPLTADFAGDTKSEIIATTIDGRIYAINGGTGKVVDGFPITLGTQPAAVPVLFEDNGIISFAAVDKNNNFSAWNIGANAGTIYWAEENGNNLNTSFIKSASNQNVVNTFFPANKAFNYPNPVYSGITQIHYYVSEDSKIDIKIFDLAGDFVAELKDDAQGGMEKETPWNVDNIQSGIYFARIQAQGVSGKTETNIIKIAVIK